ncbi:MAG: substrate-binding domain-containing protein [Lachnospiraceae bacterium]|uniref:substrate-binding domain-containing protein n=1 Tax=Parablautia sp. Marseille-Q6255 TaxID=3039593 RepID=UPI0024BD57C3|nr:substrate-binding domain-containing protein [Parablautia sp. Marseille-Q6255]
MSKRRLATVLAAATVITSVMAPVGVSADEPEFKIGIAFANENAQRWHYDEKFMVETIEAAGGEALVQWANYDQTKQENQIDNLLTQGIDALIFIAVSSNMSSTVEKVKAEGIPVVCYDNFVQDAPLDVYLDRDNKEAGKLQMQSAMDAIGGKGKIAIIHGEPTSSVVLGMKEGYDEVLKEYPDVEVVLEQYCEAYSAEKALKYAENALSANNDDIDAIVCTADVLTLGILPALESAGIAGDVYLTGMDCEVAAMQAVNQGKIGIDIWTKIDECATRAAECAISLVKGEEIEADEMVKNGEYEVPKIFVPIVGVTKDNLEEWATEIAPEGWITMDQITAEE